MNATQIHLVQTTYRASVAPLGDTAAAVFYQHLFALDPSLRTLFPDDMAAQQHKLAQTLAVVVDGLHAPQSMLDALRQLGERHAGYGVLPEHYNTVGEALLQTLQAAIGRAYTPQVREAWAEAYALLASVMQPATAQD